MNRRLMDKQVNVKTGHGVYRMRHERSETAHLRSRQLMRAVSYVLLLFAHAQLYVPGKLVQATLASPQITLGMSGN